MSAVVGTGWGTDRGADRRAARADVLRTVGASSTVVEELLAYDDTPFDLARVPRPLGAPLDAEPHVPAWERYVEATARAGVVEALAPVFPQLRFPIQAGISDSEAYRAATRRGVDPVGMPEASGLPLARPSDLRLLVHRGVAGPIPVLVTADRRDFVALVRALGMRNEPKPVPASMGASTIRGLNNWDRVRTYRRDWEASAPAAGEAGDWPAEFRRLAGRPEAYQDRLIVVSDGPYSNVAAAELGLDADEWRRVSLAIRVDHECAHYFTLRTFGISRNNALDELLADYLGIVAGAGRYRADWFLRFLGLDAFPDYRVGGRLENYLGSTALSEEAWRVLQALVVAAARNVERFDATHPLPDDALDGRARVLFALASMTLEELAHESAVDRLARFVDSAELRVYRRA